MKIYLCDRCGKKFAESGPFDKPPSLSSDPKEFGITIKMPIGEEKIYLLDVELCGSCVSSLHQWMKAVGKAAQNP